MLEDSITCCWEQEANSSLTNREKEAFFPTTVDPSSTAPGEIQQQAQTKWKAGHPVITKSCQNNRRSQSSKNSQRRGYVGTFFNTQLMVNLPNKTVPPEMERGNPSKTHIPQRTDWDHRILKEKARGQNQSTHLGGGSSCQCLPLIPTRKTPKTILITGTCSTNELVQARVPNAKKTLRQAY